MSTKNSSPPKNRIIYSVLLSLIFIGFFFFSYHIYNLLSVNFFKESYRSYLAEFVSHISQEVQTDLRDGETVNINRIVEPYLDKEIALLIVYRTNQELLQVFTKKGVTKDNLRIADQSYFLNQSEAESIYLDEESAFTIANATNKNGLILGSITPATIGVADFPYLYVLVFTIDDYLKSRKSLDATISRNSFLGGISMLALIGLGFLIKEISSRSREKKHRKRIKAIKELTISAPPPPVASPDTEKKNEPSDDGGPDDTITASSPKPTFELEDFIDHDEDDPMFGADAISASSSSAPQKIEDNKAIQTVNEKSHEFLQDFLAYFITNHTPSTYSALETNNTEELSQDGIRDFNTIENERANLEQTRLYSHRLKSLLQIWLLAHQVTASDSAQEYLTRVKKSLTVIGAPLNGNVPQQNRFDTTNISTGPVADYALPDLVGYFCPEHAPREITGKPVLTVVYPTDVVEENSYLSSVASVPWLGEEKKFFKRGEPYLEKKERAIGICTHSIIGGKPHIIKLIYTLEKYDRLTYEQKNQLLYLVELLYKLIADAPMREEELFSSKYGLENKVRNFFRKVFQYHGVVERLFSDDNPLFKLHFSLWTFSQGTLKNTKRKFTELMKTLPERLHTAFATTHNEVVFLSDHEGSIVSIGFDPATNNNTTNDTASKTTFLSTRIKEVIEQELIGDVGMESMGVQWKESVLPPPTSKEEAEKINIDDQR